MGPGRTALVFEGRSWTYGERHERVTRLAHGLRDLGVRPGDRVAYLGPNHPAFLETLFATGTLGAILVPLNFRLAGPELEYMLSDSGAHVLVHAPELTDAVTGMGSPVRARLLTVGDEYEKLIADGGTG